jgi:aminopeptidase N
LLSLGRTKNLDLIEDFTNFLFSDKVATQDIHSGAMALAANFKARLFFWEYIKTNWETVEQKMAKNKVVLQRFVRLALSKFAAHKIEQDITTFFQDKDKSGFDRGLVIVSDAIRSNANYKERDEKSLLEWLQAHGYA